MSESRPKTYAELQEEAASRWATLQRAMAEKITERAAAFARSPDVLMQPAPDEPWSHPDVAPCLGCKGPTFFVTRWATVNGRKHRAECVCTTCGATNTWDWTDRRWLE